MGVPMIILCLFIRTLGIPLRGHLPSIKSNRFSPFCRFSVLLFQDILFSSWRLVFNFRENKKSLNQNSLKSKNSNSRTKDSLFVLPPYFACPSLNKPQPVRIRSLYCAAVTGDPVIHSQLLAHAFRSETIFHPFSSILFHHMRTLLEKQKSILFSS